MLNLGFPSESAIEEYAYRMIKRDGVCPITGLNVDQCFRQYEIPGYGIADLINIEIQPFREIEITVVELKNETLKEAHLSQLRRYMAGLQRYANRFSRLAARHQWEITIRGALAGPFDSERGDFVYLIDGVTNVDVFALNISMEHGFSSECQSSKYWYSSSENLKKRISIASEVFSRITEAHRAEPNNVISIAGEQ